MANPTHPSMLPNSFLPQNPSTNYDGSDKKNQPITEAYDDDDVGIELKSNEYLSTEENKIVE